VELSANKVAEKVYKLSTAVRKKWCWMPTRPSNLML